MKNAQQHIPYSMPEVKNNDLITSSSEFFHKMDSRRSVRDFSNKDVPREVIENIIRTASTAPSGAHKQPWTFCAVSNTELKRKLREAAEQEEKLNYEKRMSDEWLNDLKPIGTDHVKPFFEDAPWLIIVFRKIYDLDEGVKKSNYYINESVGIACGMLLSAIHHCGLVALTHTPSPMGFLANILNRPKNERAFLNIPVGYPAQNAMVPDLVRKPLEEIAVFYE